MKVLVWNIEKFTEERFEDGYVVRGNFKRRKIYYTAQEILDYMQQVFTGNGNASHTPEVIAILEVLAPPALGLGALLPRASTGAQGLFRMLGYIKAWTGNANWRLVPALKCNPAPPPATPWAQSEVVGVFYDDSRVDFRGPYAWVAGQSQDPAVGAAATYDHGVVSPWNDATITNATTRAGQVQFFLPNGNEITFPGMGNRRPFMVDFRERYGANRDMRFGFVHTSPGFHQEGTRECAHVREMRGNAVGDPPITIFAGDFNVNDYSLNTRRYSFRPLQNQRFWKMFTKRDQISTHYFPTSDAEPFNWWTYQQEKVIDNFLVRHKTAAQAPLAVYTKASMDAAMGWPAPYATSMNITLGNIVTYDNPIEAFRYWENFWHIRKCSDHTPTFLDIQ